MPIPFEQITVQAARTLIASEPVTLLDIRDQPSFDASRIDRAITLTDETVNAFMACTDRAIPLIVYCYHGISSQGAAAYFSQQGFERVYSLIGGYEAWAATPHT